MGTWIRFELEEPRWVGLYSTASDVMVSDVDGSDSSALTAPEGCPSPSCLGCNVNAALEGRLEAGLYGVDVGNASILLLTRD